ncbi:hypothetical protein F4825DRAFT_449065 [Nemania diffusa]|nr:hypothetical protein F4825DRAFT_449065 [Nemania diffusa]
MASDTDGAISQPTESSSQTIARFARKLKSSHFPVISVAPEPRLPHLNGVVSDGNQSSSASSPGPLALGKASVPSSPGAPTQNIQSSGTKDSRAFPKLLEKIKTNGVEKFHQRQPLEVFKELPVPADARRRFEELQSLFRSGLAAHIKLESFQYAVMWEVYMVGTSAQDAEPMSVFYSDKKLAKKINGFFKQSHIQETMNSSDTNFPFHFVKKPPRFLGNGVDTGPIRTAPLNGILFFWTAPLENGISATACGLPIAATLGSSSVWATIGGNVLVDGALFGMTAGHLLSQLLSGSDSASQSITSSDTEDDSSILESDTSGPELESLNNSMPALFDLTTAQRIVSRDLSESEYREDIANLDYTLVRLPPALCLPNKMDKSNITFGREKASKELLDITEACVDARFDIIEVILMSANGYKPAVLKMRSASILVSPSIDFVNTLTLSPIQGFTLEKGDSGSWVVESSKGQVYGHLVVGLANGDGMIVPIHTSLEDMKKLTGDSTVKLPTAEDIRSLSMRITESPAIPIAQSAAIPIAQSAVKTTSRDGISSINTWVTSISSQSEGKRFVPSTLPPLLEIPISNTPSSQRTEGNVVLSETAVRTEMPDSDSEAAANDVEDAQDIEEEMSEAKGIHLSESVDISSDSANAVYDSEVSFTQDGEMRKSLRDYRINDFLWNPRHQGPFDWLVYTESTADQQSHRSRVILEQQLQRAVEAIDSAFSTATGEHVD